MDLLLTRHLWPLRVLWIALALLSGSTVSDALADRSAGSVVAVVAVIAWLGWAGALVALLVPRTVSLTTVRLLIPGGLLAASAAVALGSTLTVLDGTTLAVAAAATVLALGPYVADELIDGSSYGPERRLALRTPAMLAGVATALWFVMVPAATVGPLLLAAGVWIPGLAATVVGALVLSAGIRSVHVLSRRWLVLVPSGMVIHDPVTMPEPQLFLRHTMRRIGPAPAVALEAEETEDLTAAASGLAMELVMADPADLLVNVGRRATASRRVDRVLFTPTLPDRFLTEAAGRRLPVGPDASEGPEVTDAG